MFKAETFSDTLAQEDSQDSYVVNMLMKCWRWVNKSFIAIFAD
jgi:hypothetical protein